MIADAALRKIRLGSAGRLDRLAIRPRPWVEQDRHTLRITGRRDGLLVRRTRVRMNSRRGGAGVVGMGRGQSRSGGVAQLCRTLNGEGETVLAGLEQLLQSRWLQVEGTLALDLICTIGKNCHRVYIAIKDLRTGVATTTAGKESFKR